MVVNNVTQGGDKLASLPIAEPERPIVWTIAGSDSGGGAGIQADLATMSDLGCHGCSVITGVTAQSSVSVAAVEPVSPAMLRAQLNTLLLDMPPKAIKVGLLCHQGQIDLLAKWLATELANYLDDNALAKVPVIIDPVLVATCGDSLTSSPGSDAKRQAQHDEERAATSATKKLDFSPLAPFLTLLTPNLDELYQLAKAGTGLDREQAEGYRTHSYQALSEIERDADNLASALQVNLLAKGGDMVSPESSHLAQDYLICMRAEGVSPLHQNSAFILTSPRQDTSNSHGTGCTLSSAIAAAMAHGYVLHDGIVLAKAYVNQGLALSYRPGKGAGPLGRGGWPKELALFPHIEQVDGPSASQDEASVFSSYPRYINQAKGFLPIIDDSTENKPSSDKPKVAKLGLYPIVDNIDDLAELLSAGAETIQLRIKRSEQGLSEAGLAQDKKLRNEIAQAIALGKRFSARVFINDHWQLALELGAYGIHLGQEDLYRVDLDSIHKAGMALGLSSHSYFEALLAHQMKPSYIAFGHIFATQTKVMPSLPQGLPKLARYGNTFGDHYPCVAIGGINATNLAAVKQTGIGDVAIVSANTKPGAGCSVTQAFSQLSLAWNKGHYRRDDYQRNHGEVADVS